MKNTIQIKEGWMLSECFGSLDGTPQIQKDDEQGKFANDKEALIFVIEQAEKGSEYHKNALIEVIKNNPKELLMLTKNI